MLCISKKKKRVRAIELSLNKINSIKLDLTGYALTKKISENKNIRENIKIINYNNKKQKDRLNIIYWEIYATILDNLENLNSFSLLSLKQIIEKIYTIKTSKYNKYDLKKINYLMSVLKKADYILISKSVELLNSARTLHNHASKMLMENEMKIPLEAMEEMQEDLFACLKNVDFSKHPDIQVSISEMIVNLDKIMKQSQKQLILK